MSVEVETTNLLGDIEFIKPPSLLQKIGGGLTGLATGQISKNDFFRDAVVLNVLDELDVPSIVKNNLNKSEKAQNIALDAIQQAVGSPVNLTALDENRYLADYRKQVGPGILSLQSELGRGQPTGSVRFDSRNFMIAPKTTARFGAGIDNLGKEKGSGVFLDNHHLQILTGDRAVKLYDLNHEEKGANGTDIYKVVLGNTGKKRWVKIN